MFKKIPGNNLYKISLDGKVVGLDEAECTLPILDGKVHVEMYGQMVFVDIGWLSLISHYEVDLPEPVKLKIFNIHFTEVQRKLIRPIKNKLMVFKFPIIVNRKYRIVPGYTRYAISSNGKVIDLKDNSLVEIKFYKNNIKNCYPYVNIYDNSKNKNRKITLHRLLALAWIKNDDVFNKTVVNHKDGNKLNYSLHNLEWVNVSGNNNHAFETGLRKDNIKCKVRDKDSGIITEFSSLANASVFMGLSPDYFRTNNLYIRQHKLIRNKFELRLFDDVRPWFYENKGVTVNPSRFIITLKWPDNNVETLYGPRELKKRLKYFNSGGDGLSYLISLAKIDYPDLIISVQDTYNVEAIQALRLSDNKVFEANTITEMAKITGVHKKKIRDHLINTAIKNKPLYLFRRKSEEDWNTELTYHPSSAVCILATNIVTSQKLVFESLTKISKYFNVDRSVIKNRLDTNKSFNDWIFSQTDK